MSVASTPHCAPRKALPAHGLPDAAAALAEARQLVQAEARAVLSLQDSLDDGYLACLAALWACRGHIVVTGMGKSGLVGQKISATFASTGAPSLFMHAADALHGDLGRISGDDVVLVLSNSGESAEIVELIRPVRALGATLVAMTRTAQSTLGARADAVLAMGHIDEACPMNLVPTASTTAMLVLGDALAMGLFKLRGLGQEAFARYHPGGALGRKLMRVHEVMRTGAANPAVATDTPLRRVIAVMSETPGRPGAACVVDASGRVVGFFTDGDLRRLLEQRHFAIDVPIGQVMHANPKCVHPDTLVADAAQLLQTHQIDQVPVVDEQSRSVGLLDVQDVLSLR